MAETPHRATLASSRRGTVGCRGGDATRRRALIVASRSVLLTASALVAVLPRSGARAQPAAGWPQRPVRIVVPVSPGGPMDLLARGLAEKLTETWHQSVVVENRPGGGTAIGAEHVARAAPDGHTLLLAASAHVMNPPLLPRLAYDPVRDFTAIVQVASQPMVLALHPSVPATSLAEFVTLARARPEAISMGSAGIGTLSHMAALLFALRAEARFTLVPYAGAAPLQTALLGGQVQSAFLNATVATAQIREGRLRGLAATSAERWRELPDLPTVAELGFPGYEASAWYGFLAPAGLPPALAARLHRDIAAALRRPDLARRIEGAGMDLRDLGPEPFGELLATELEQWTRVVRAAGLRSD